MRAFIGKLAKDGPISGPLILLIMDIVCLGLAVEVVVVAYQAFRQFRVEKNKRLISD